MNKKLVIFVCVGLYALTIFVSANIGYGRGFEDAWNKPSVLCVK
jgi:hypothetical protein